MPGYWWREHLQGFEPTTPSSRGGMPIHYTDEGSKYNPVFGGTKTVLG